MFCSELTIKDKVLKIFTALLLTNVNLTRPQPTKSALRFRRSISLNENENDYFFFSLTFFWIQNVIPLGCDKSVNIFLKIKNQESLHADPFILLNLENGLRIR